MVLVLKRFSSTNLVPGSNFIFTIGLLLLGFFFFSFFLLLKIKVFTSQNKKNYVFLRKIKINYVFLRK